LLASILVAVPFAGTALPIKTEDPSVEVVNRYLDACQTQREVLRGAQMEVDIDARLPKLEKQGKLQALRSISRLGQITYKALGFSGDNTVKQEVITRYLAAETEGRDSGATAITPANYKFRLKAKITQDGQTTYIFDLSPKQKRIGLFKGELWLDGATGMPLKEAGQLVKNPSVFLKKVEFVHDYEIRDGIAFPKHLESKIDTRLVGRAELSIEFSHFTRPEPQSEKVAPTDDH
jgi:hypothetical protein